MTGSKPLNRIIRLTRPRALALAVLLLSIPACATNPVTGEKEFMLVSQEQEIELGREAAPSLRWTYGGEYRDPELSRYLGGVVREIWEVSERPDLPMEFVVQNTSVPNAFALPGYVAMTRGLLVEMENEAQFAAVMGHEAGHVMARHTAKRLSFGMLQQAGLLLGSVALSDVEGGDILLSAGAVGSTLLLLKYDRGQELQSDRLGVKYMARLGYDPNAAIGAHRTLQRAVDNYLERLGKKRSESTFMDAMLSTHPRHEVRLEEISSMIDSLGSYTVKKDGLFEDRFDRALKEIRRVDRAYHPYDVAKMHYENGDLDSAREKLSEALALNDSQAPFHHLWGMINLKEGDYESAEVSFERALSLWEDYQPAVYGTGVLALKRGEEREAVDRLKRSLELFPGHPGSVYGLGLAHYRLREYREAVEYLSSFGSAAPTHPEVHGYLGLSLEGVSRPTEAVNEYYRQLEVAPDNEMGRTARQRLRALGVALPGG